MPNQNSSVEKGQNNLTRINFSIEEIRTLIFAHSVSSCPRYLLHLEQAPADNFSHRVVQLVESRIVHVEVGLTMIVSDDKDEMVAGVHVGDHNVRLLIKHLLDLRGMEAGCRTGPNNAVRVDLGKRSLLQLVVTSISAIITEPVVQHA